MSRRRKQKTKKPRRIDISPEQAKALIKRASENMSAEDTEVIKGMADTLFFLSQSADQKSQSIRRLLKIIFGSSSERSKDILPPEEPEPNNSGDSDSNPSESDPEESENEGTAKADRRKGGKPKGEGRLKPEDYSGASTEQFACEHLKHGDACPLCRKGKLYFKEPERLVRLTSSAPLQASIYEIERYRCNTCGETFKADLPEHVGKEKYDSKSIAMLCLLHYGAGMPFNRLEHLQASVGVPLPSSTQWDMVVGGAISFFPIMEYLMNEAANGKIIHNDDTTAKILEFMGKRKGDKALQEDKPHRKGMFTTGIVSQLNDHQIALYCTGVHHAGENLEALLKKRQVDYAPIQMCDGLEHNVPKELKTILANCMAHARRKFVEIFENFPEKCKHVILELAKVYHNDAYTREQNMTDHDRLAYHKENSELTMSDLRLWMQKQIDEKEVEPNSGLGQAINYSLKRWEALTLFLKKPGAPLDNNICYAVYGITNVMPHS
ncbi:MAG: transposase [Planctomycetes bacterium]|nr:transposase [Planctomycetota bacterium]